MVEQSKDEQIAPATPDWAGEQGERWLAHIAQFEAMIAPIGVALIERAAYQAGERVVDIGCGGGVSTSAIAARVTPGGEALGLDIAPMLVRHAEEVHKAQTGLRFLCEDAAETKLADGPYDRLHSRFGSMFFDDPHSAFANLKAMLVPGARIDLAVWAAPNENEWVSEVGAVVRNYVDTPPPEPRAPGPFAFEDLDYARDVLNAGGFSAMEAVEFEAKLPVGGNGADPAQAASFMLNAPGIGKALREQSEAIRASALQELEGLMARHMIAGKGVHLSGKAWLISAVAG